MINNIRIGRAGLELTHDEQEPAWTDVPGDPRIQKMEEALRAILIEATRVERGNFVSLVDDLSKIRDIAYAGLEGTRMRRPR